MWPARIILAGPGPAGWLRYTINRDMPPELLNDLEQQMVPRGEVGVVVDKWAKTLTPTPGDEKRQFKNKANVFKKAKMDQIDPATDIDFWLKYGVRYWVNLEGEVLGKTGTTLSRDHIKISSELAKEATEKVKAGKDIEKLSLAEHVSMLVLTKAKLLAAEKMATNIYSELRSDFEAAKREVDKELTKLLVNKTRVSDVNNEIDWNRVIPAGKMAFPAAVTLFSILLSACSTPAEARPTGETPMASGPTATEVATTTPTATATETIPTEVPISYEIPMTADGKKIDIDKIVNVVPESKKDREAYFAKVKAYLVAQQAETVSDPRGIMSCNIGIDRGDWDPATQVRIFCHVNLDYGEGISPGLLSKDMAGNVIMTFLGNFRGTDGKWTQQRLINVVIYEDEMTKKYLGTSREGIPTSRIWEYSWRELPSLDLAFGGNIRTGYVRGKYPRMEALIDRNYREGVRDDVFEQPHDNDWLRFDGVIFPAYIVQLSE